MPGIREGIYLEQKKGQLGTGHTASSVEYRNFYAVCLAGEDTLHLHLLTEKLKPTGLVETVAIPDFSSDFRFVPKAQKWFDAIAPALRKAAPAPPVASTAPAPAAAPQTKPAQAKPDKAYKPYVQESEGSWWEKTSKGSDLLKK